MAAPQLAFGPDRLRLLVALERTHFWFVARRLLVNRLLNRLGLRPGAAVLDVGCGTGSFARELASAGFRVLALDVQPDALRHDRDWPPTLRVTHAEAERLPVADASFHAVVALDVLEHTDDARVMAEIVRALEPGGAVVITVPALPWLWSQRDRSAGHLRRYTRRQLRSLIRTAGLEIVDVRFYQCLLLPAFIATRLAARRSAGPLRTEEQPAGWFNGLALAINRFEVRAGDLIPWPIGSSLAAVGRKAL